MPQSVRETGSAHRGLIAGTDNQLGFEIVCIVHLTAVHRYYTNVNLI
jgi:hypothetical protein